MNVLFTIAAFVVALGLLIVIHELGHYVVARWCNVKVLRFSVGFGKPLWRTTRGADATEWVVAAIPLGGYVKMADEREAPVAPGDLARAFNRQPVQRRVAIVSAGPIANFLLAIALYWVLFLHGVPGIKPVLGPVASGTPALAAGFAAGDVITRVGSEPVTTWQDARWLLLQHAVQRSVVEVEVTTEAGAIARRGLDLSRLTPADLDGDFLNTLGLRRFRLQAAPEISRIIAGGPADRAGLREADEITAIDNQKINSAEDAIRIIRERPGRTLLFEVRRSGATLPAVAVVPDSHREKDGQMVGRIGAMLQYGQATLASYVTHVRYGPIDALGKALERTWDTALFSLKMLGKMIVGEVSLKNLSGPITIADYAGQTAQSGWIPYLLFLALISISLGVLNLLPIPLLDGGHLMYYIFEMVTGRPVSERAMEIGQQVGMALLFTLMVFALYNDINRLLNG